VEGKVGIRACLRDAEGTFLGAMTNFCHVVIVSSQHSVGFSPPSDR
jgi:hypothetical protein